MIAPPVVLAHGALGPFDEIIFLGVGAVFLVLMGVSWLRSRGQTDSDNAAAPSAAAESHGTPDPSTEVSASAAPADRYTLE